MGILTKFLNRITLFKINRDAEDRIRWQPTTSNLFEEKSYYRELYAGGMHLLPWKGIWRVKVLNSCLFVCFILNLIIIIIIISWTTTLRKILTFAN